MAPGDLMVRVEAGQLTTTTLAMPALHSENMRATKLILAERPWNSPLNLECQLAPNDALAGVDARRWP